jgi:uncharacterized small protein (DUF1192 family)
MRRPVRQQIEIDARLRGLKKAIVRPGAEKMRKKAPKSVTG